MKLSASALILFCSAAALADGNDNGHHQDERALFKIRGRLFGPGNRNGNGNGNGGNNDDDLFPLKAIRSIEGNDRYDGRGEAETMLTRMAQENSYADKGGEIMMDGPNPRTISNTVVALPDGTSILNARGHSDMLWAWGQFLDHDIGK